MKSVKEIVLNLALSSKLKKNLLLLELLQKNWEKIIGEEFSLKTKPTLIKEEILWIEVPNHYVLQICSGKTLIILEKIKEILPEEFQNSLKEIRFKINPSLEVLEHKKNFKITASNSLKLKTFLKFCEEIHDPELKKIFIRMFKNYVKLQNF